MRNLCLLESQIKKAMKTTTFIIFLMILSAIFVSAQSNSRDEKIEKQIREVMDKQVEAWNQGDIEGFMQGYWKSEEMTFVSGNNVSKGWQAAFDRYKKGYDTPEKMGTLSFTELEITVLSKSSAFVKGRFTLERENDKPTGIFTLVFRKFKDGWKVVHDHTST